MARLPERGRRARGRVFVVADHLRVSYLQRPLRGALMRSGDAPSRRPPPSAGERTRAVRRRLT